MFFCKPERSVKQTRLLLLVCVLATAGTFLVGSLIQKYSPLINLVGFAFLAVSILLVVRYSLTEMEYSFDNEDFTIIKKIGYRSQTVCCVSLSTAKDLITKAEYDALPREQKAIIKYSLNQNMFADSYVFLCDFNGKSCKIEFEPNKQFAALLKAKIDEVRAQSETLQ